MSERSGSSEDPRASFIFVPHGDPEPTEWMAAHPDWIKVPATLVPAGATSSGGSAPPDMGATAVAGTAAIAAPGMAEGLGAGALGDIGLLLAEVAAPFAALGILLYPSHTASPGQDELHPGGIGFDPHPPTPPLPGLEPPAAGDPRPREGGFTPLAAAPPNPGFDPAPPQPHMLSGRPAEEQGPIILQQNRNNGLAGGAKTASQRAREAARQADPAVTQALPDADWRAHHLINVAGLRVASGLIAAAARAGWRTDDPGNVAPLPASPAAQQKLQAAGINRPVHNSGHPNWNVGVGDRLRSIEMDLKSRGLQPGDEIYARRAREELEKLQKDLRQKMLRAERLTQIETSGNPATT